LPNLDRSACGLRRLSGSGLPDCFDKIYQNGGKQTKLPLNYQMAVIYLFQMTNKKYQYFPFQGTSNVTQMGIFGSKICIPSGNPDLDFLKYKINGEKVIAAERNES
jgi:hypothetical protein